MKLILPVAGKGSRLRPHTHTKAKCLINVAGKTVLQHILDKLKPLNIEQTIFIVDDNINQIKDFIDNNYNINATYIKQEQALGPAHAIYLAKDHIKENDDILIIYSDTLFEIDLNIIRNTDADGLIFSKETDDPLRFGLIKLENNKITNLVEKPETPISNLAIVGMYYIKKGQHLIREIENDINNNKTTKGEFFLTNPLLNMINKGANFKAPKIDVWLDCGKPETLLKTNEYLLNNGHSNRREGKNTVIVQPVNIAEGVQIENSVIGPNVTIAKNTIIKESNIKNSIISENSVVEGMKLDGSIIGRDAKLTGSSRQLNVGDNSEIKFG